MRELRGGWKRFAAFLVAAWTVFIFYTALTLPFTSIIQGGVSISLATTLVFLIYPLSKKRFNTAPASPRDKLLFGDQNSPALLDIFFMVLALIPTVFVMLNIRTLMNLPHLIEIKTYHLVFSAILVVMLLEATRRSLGNIVPIVVLLFVGYALFGQYIPGFFRHGGLDLVTLLSYIYIKSTGIWGLLTDITSRVIAVFIIFGPVIFATGVGKGFMDIARYFGGRVQGGAGQIAVISSAFFGTISGSAAANVASTGSFTIPTMKRLGYPPAFAGAVEAAASTGGMIMPPIMGAGAFVMAEILGIPYTTVMIAAVIPGILYFLGVGCGVYSNAGRRKLGKLPPELMPGLKEVFEPHQVMMVFVPLATLVVLLLQFYEPEYCAAVAVLVAAGLYMLAGGRLSPGPLFERVKTIAKADYSAVATSLAWLMVMMSSVQIIVIIIQATGFGVRISELIQRLAEANVMFALAAAMLTAIVLGMGISQTAAYVIAAAVLAPGLIIMGVPELTTHLFIFYFAAVSSLTPPVCIAVFTAAAISGANWLRIAWIAMRLAVAAYVIPFIFAFHPTLLMKGDPLHILADTASVVAAVVCLAGGLFGYLIKPATLLERVILVIAGVLFFQLTTFTAIVGSALVVLYFISQRFLHALPIIGERQSGRQ